MTHQQRPAVFVARTSPDGRVSTLGPLDRMFGHPIATGGPEPQGVWSAWRYEDGVLRAATDRLGYGPLFYAELGGGVAVSPSLVALLEHVDDRSFDEVAIAAFIRTCFYAGNATPFARVKQLRPGGRLTWSAAGGLHVDESPFLPPSASESATDAIVDAYIDLFRQAVSRRLPAGPFAATLSGGRDSRQILLELAHQGHRPASVFTLGAGSAQRPQHTADTTAAFRLAQSLGVPIELVGLSATQPADERRKNTVTHLIAQEHGWLVPLAERCLRAEPIAYEGTGCGIFSRSRLTDDDLLGFLRNDPPALAEFVFDRWGLHEDGIAFLPEPFGFVRTRRDDAVRHLLDELALYKEAPNPLATANFNNRNRRAIGCWPSGVLGGIQTVHTPFLDHDLCDLIASIPVRTIRAPEVQTLAIRKAFPEHAGVPFYDELDAKDKPAPATTRASLKVRNITQRVGLGLSEGAGWAIAHAKVYRWKAKGPQRLRGWNALINLQQLLECQRPGGPARLLDEAASLYGAADAWTTGVGPAPASLAAPEARAHA